MFASWLSPGLLELCSLHAVCTPLLPGSAPVVLALSLTFLR